MNCAEITYLLDDYIDELLPAGQAEAVAAHVSACPNCAARVAREHQLRARLRRLPAPEPDEAFFDRAIARAVEHENRRRHWRWLGTGAALAASLVLVIGLSTQLQGVDPLAIPPQAGLEPAPEAPAPAATREAPPVEVVESFEERTITLMVESPRSMDSATFTVTLPDGIELAGHPGVSEISWVGQLASGKNLLVLPIRARIGSGGNIVTHVSHTGQSRTITLHVEALGEQKSLLRDQLPDNIEPVTVM